MSQKSLCILLCVTFFKHPISPTFLENFIRETTKLYIILITSLHKMLGNSAQAIRERLGGREEDKIFFKLICKLLYFGKVLR